MAIMSPVIRFETHFPHLTFKPNPLPSKPVYIAIKYWGTSYHVTRTDETFKVSSYSPYEFFNQINVARFEPTATGWHVYGFFARKEGQEAGPQEKVIDTFNFADNFNGQSVELVERSVRRWQQTFLSSCCLTLFYATHVAAQSFFTGGGLKSLSKIHISVLLITTLITYGSYKGYQKAALKLALIVASAFDACKVNFETSRSDPVQFHHQLISYGYHTSSK